MLVKRKRVLFAVVFPEVATKPMGKLLVDGLNGFSDCTSGKGGPSATGAIGDNHSKTLVCGSCP